MKFAVSAALAAVLTFCLAATSFAAPSLTSVTAEGTVGTALTITGTELGTKPPKAFLRLAGDATAKPFPLKLSKPFDGSTINATVVKIEPGTYDLLVTPKGGTELTLAGAFTARAPQFGSFSSAQASIGGTVEINGSFFGTKKGKVTCAGITAKVKVWTDTKITIQISKKNQAGTVTIDLIGKGGTADDVGSLGLVAPLTGKDHITVNFDSGGATLNATDPKTTFAIDNAGVTFVLNGTQKFGSGLSTNQHIINVVVSAPPNPNTFTAGQILVTYQEAGIAAQMYSSVGAAGWTLTIDQRAGDRIGGTFSGGLKKSIGGGPNFFNVTGNFLLTIKR